VTQSEDEELMCVLSVISKVCVRHECSLRANRIPSLGRILVHMKSVHTFTQYLFKIHFVIFPCTLRYFKLTL
jgi:hypothetical protein